MIGWVIVGIGAARNIPNLAQVNSSPLGFGVLLLWTIAGVWWLLQPYTVMPVIFALAAWFALVLQLSRPFWMRIPS